MIFNKNDKAISPIVATLILIIVALVGAIAVGSVLGLFSENVGSQAGSNNVSQNYNDANSLNIAGSTTMYPINNLLATAFMKKYPGSKITIGQGGSGAGITQVVAGSIDLAASSSTANLSLYPNLVGTQIGGRGVVLIGGSNISIQSSKAINASTAKAIYSTGTSTYTLTAGDNLTGATTITVYQRSEDGSGTEKTFLGWAGWKDASGNGYGDTTPAITGPTAVAGNEGVLAAVQGNKNSIGFVDWGYANGAASITVLPVVGDDGSINTPGDANIKAELKSSGANTYPAKLVSPLWYYSNGPAKPIAGNFESFALDSSNEGLFTQAGVFSLADINA